MKTNELMNQRFGYATSKLSEAIDNGDAYDTIYWRGYKDAVSAMLHDCEEGAK